jgi:F0F1-type ATP synthase membrane subunit b/b'
MMEVLMLNRSILAAMAAAGLFVVGCNEEKEVDVQKAAETAADKTKEAGADSADATGEALKAVGDKIAEGGEALKEKAAEIAPDATKAAEELYTKAKAAVDSGKLEDAKPLVEQLKGYMDKVPPEWQEKIKTLVADYAKKAASGAIPGLPK